MNTLDLYFKFFMMGGSLEKKSFYDEEGVEGWVFTINDFGKELEFTICDSWDEIPEIPEDLIKFLNSRSNVI